MSWPAPSERTREASDNPSTGSQHSDLTISPFVPSLGDRARRSRTPDLSTTPSIFAYDIDGGPFKQSVRGWLGAVMLTSTGAILPHEGTYDEVVASRLELIMATGADLDPLYLLTVPRSDRPASAPTDDANALLSDVVSTRPPTLTWTAADGVTHRIWQVSHRPEIDAVRAWTSRQTAIIADGHHRYAAYLRRRADLGAQHGPGSWDAALALLVDAETYVPTVAPVHRVVADQPFALAVAGLRPLCEITVLDGASLFSSADLELTAQAALAGGRGRGGDLFVALLTDGEQVVRVADTNGALGSHVRRATTGPVASRLSAVPDASIAVEAVVGSAWGRHPFDAMPVPSVEKAVWTARTTAGTAILLAPTPTTAVIEMAREGLTLPQKSTLFVPKPAAGLIDRILGEQVCESPHPSVSDPTCAPSAPM